MPHFLRLHVLAAALVAAPAAQADVRTVDTEAGRVAVEQLADGLDHPWGMAFLPDGRLLVTERAGALRILDSDGALSNPLSGVPEVYARRQGGLLDVALDPDFAENRMVYLSYADHSEEGATTALGRGRLDGERIADFEPLFREEPRIDNGLHFGGRIVFAPDGTLFLTLGERFQFDPAQDLSNHLGTIVRLNRDGSVPEDNPFVGQDGAEDAIWSYGHRNIEGAAVRPDTGELWVAEMGPKGGDELNHIQAGRNYGWPLVSWGQHYDGKDIPDPPIRADLVDAVEYWVPSISPSGLLFYTGELFPKWRGNALIGGLTAHGIVRVAIDGDTVKGEERIGLGARIRDVEQAPDGSIYVLTDEDNGKILRLRPL